MSAVKVVADPVCVACTLLTGFGSDGAYNLTRSTDGPRLGSPSALVCPRDYQCVGLPNATSGCCSPCARAQVCPVGTYAKGGVDHAGEWNLCPPGRLCQNGLPPDGYEGEPEDWYAGECPKGSACVKNEEVDCASQRNVPIKAGYGDLYAGTYCPAGALGLRFCPQGKFCEKMGIPQPCPKGYFCPLRTETPLLKCVDRHDCPGGAVYLKRSLNALWIFAIFLVVALLFGSKIKKGVEKKIAKQHEKNATTDDATTDDPTDDPTDAKPNTQEVNHETMVKTAYSKIASLIQKNELLRPKLAASEDLQMFVRDEESLFQLMDLDGSEKLSYEEINTLLQLSDSEIKYFVRRINQLSGACLDAQDINKKAFVDHFYQVYVHTMQFTRDCSLLFADIDTDNNGTIEGMELHSTEVLGTYLTASQIHNVLMKFVKHYKVKDMNKLKITKKDFCQHFDDFLKDVIEESVAYATLHQGIDITFKDLTLTVETKTQTKTVVDKVTGRLAERTMTAIMGGSGAGKTSLLNALCGRAFYGKVHGDIQVNGAPADIQDLKHSMGFVPQDDIVHAELTVKENFLYAGRFRLPAGTTEEEIDKLAEEVIASLGLVRVRHSRVGDVRRRGVSGGEKKRVNAGLELMSRPKILFLDEPTSGLDSASSLLVMGSLKRLVQEQGMTLATVIHQPRRQIFAMFDNVILLGAGGASVYHGAPDNIVPYFQGLGYDNSHGSNLADWIVDISTGSVPAQQSSGSNIRQNWRQKQDNRNQLFQAWNESFDQMPQEQKKENFQPPDQFALPEEEVLPNFFHQVKFHFFRNFLISSRNYKSRLIDSFVVLAAVFLITFLNKPIEYVGEDFLLKENEDYLQLPISTIMSEDPTDIPLADLFRPYVAAIPKSISAGMQVAVIFGVLVTLNSTKYMSAKLLEFYRESASGYNVDAYFLAINITSSVEVMIQTLLTGFIGATMRNPLSNWWAYIANFLMLAWICVSWSFVFSIAVPPKNMVVVAGFFMAFFGLLFCGGMPPLTFETIYDNRAAGAFAGLFSPTRYFVETYAVSDFKCLPEQTGFTSTADNVPVEELSFHVAHLGRLDADIDRRSCGGWTWGYLPAFLVGLTLRGVAGLLLHSVNREKQNLSSLGEELRTDRKFALKYAGAVYFIILAIMCTVFAILTTR